MCSIVDLTCFSGEMTELHLLTEFKLCELNFAPGKLPLNRSHRDDCPDIKPILYHFIPRLHLKTLFKQKTFKYIKKHIAQTT